MYLYVKRVKCILNIGNQSVTNALYVGRVKCVMAITRFFYMFFITLFA